MEGKTLRLKKNYTSKIKNDFLKEKFELSNPIEVAVRHGDINAHSEQALKIGIAFCWRYLSLK